jgi:chromate transporter
MAQIGGPLGGLAAALGMFGPPALLAALMAHLWGFLSNDPWPKALKRALLPLGVGLMAGGALTLGRSAISDWRGLALALLTALVLWRYKLHPLWLLALGALAGLLLG